MRPVKYGKINLVINRRCFHILEILYNNPKGLSVTELAQKIKSSIGGRYYAALKSVRYFIVKEKDPYAGKGRHVKLKLNKYGRLFYKTTLEAIKDS